MTRNIISTSAAILCLTLAPVTSGDDARALLEKSVAAHGGLERFRAIHDWHITAERRIAGEPGVEVYEEYLLREGDLERTLLLKKRGASVLVFGHDGRTGFALTDGELRGDEEASSEGYYRAHGEYYLRALPFKWMDPGVRLSHAGRERLGGREFDRLRISAGENVGPAWRDVWVAVIDRETSLLVEARLTHHQPAGVTEITYRYSDYRDVGGLRFAHRLEYWSSGRKTGENVIRDMDVDSGVPAALFSPGAHRR